MTLSDYITIKQPALGEPLSAYMKAMREVPAMAQLLQDCHVALLLARDRLLYIDVEEIDKLVERIEDFNSSAS